MALLWNEIVGMYGTFKSVIIYTLIRFCITQITMLIGILDLIFVCSLAYSVLSVLEWKLQCNFKSKYLFVLLNSQAILNLNVTNIEESVSLFAMIQNIFDITTVLLLLQCFVLLFDQKMQYMYRIITLTLYMYADSVEQILNSVNLSFNRLIFAIVFFLMASKITSVFPDTMWIHVLKAFKIVCVNLIFADTIKNESTSYVILTYNIILILLICRLSLFAIRIYKSFQDVEDFAIWKTGNLLSTSLQVHAIDNGQIATVCVLMLCFFSIVSQNFKNSKAMANVSVLLKINCLVLINAILNQFQKELSYFVGSQAIILLVFFLIIVEKFVVFLKD